MDIGSKLREARIRKRPGIADAEEVTKIRSVYLEAMEENNFAKLPPGIYRSGSLRVYARFAGIGADELVTVYREATGSAHGRDEAD